MSPSLFLICGPEFFGTPPFPPNPSKTGRFTWKITITSFWMCWFPPRPKMIFSMMCFVFSFLPKNSPPPCFQNFPLGDFLCTTLSFLKWIIPFSSVRPLPFWSFLFWATPISQNGLLYKTSGFFVFWFFGVFWPPLRDLVLFGVFLGFCFGWGCFFGGGWGGVGFFWLFSFFSPKNEHPPFFPLRSYISNDVNIFSHGMLQSHHFFFAHYVVFLPPILVFVIFFLAELIKNQSFNFNVSRPWQPVYTDGDTCSFSGLLSVSFNTPPPSRGLFHLLGSQWENKLSSAHSWHSVIVSFPIVLDLHCPSKFSENLFNFSPSRTLEFFNDPNISQLLFSLDYHFSTLPPPPPPQQKKFQCHIQSGPWPFHLFSLRWYRAVNFKASLRRFIRNHQGLLYGVLGQIQFPPFLVFDPGKDFPFDTCIVSPPFCIPARSWRRSLFLSQTWSTTPLLFTLS